MAPDTQPFKIRNAFGVESEGSGVVKTWTREAALMQAAKWGGGVFAVALLMLPIPLVHFASPVVALFVAPFVAFIVYRMHAGGHDLEAQGTCPSCKGALTIKASVGQWPLRGHCPSCRESYAAEPLTAGTA